MYKEFNSSSFCGGIKGQDFICYAKCLSHEKVADYMGQPMEVRSESLPCRGEVVRGRGKKCNVGGVGKIDAEFKEDSVYLGRNLDDRGQSIHRYGRAFARADKPACSKLGCFRTYFVGTAIAIGVLSTATFVKAGFPFCVYSSLGIYYCVDVKPSYMVAVVIGVVIGLMYSWIKSVGGIRDRMVDRRR